MVAPKISIYSEPMTISLFGKRIFADVIKLGSQDKTTLDHPVGPKSNDKRPRKKRHTKEKCEEGHVKTEAEKE